MLASDDEASVEEAVDDGRLGAGALAVVVGSLAGGVDATDGVLVSTLAVGAEEVELDDDSVLDGVEVVVVVVVLTLGAVTRGAGAGVDLLTLALGVLLGSGSSLAVFAGAGVAFGAGVATGAGSGTAGFSLAAGVVSPAGGVASATTAGLAAAGSGSTISLSLRL